jgi:hypothetical protein
LREYNEAQAVQREQPPARQRLAEQPIWRPFLDPVATQQFEVRRCVDQDKYRPAGILKENERIRRIERRQMQLSAEMKWNGWVQLWSDATSNRCQIQIQIESQDKSQHSQTLDQSKYEKLEFSTTALA